MSHLQFNCEQQSVLFILSRLFFRSILQESLHKPHLLNTICKSPYVKKKPNILWLIQFFPCSFSNKLFTAEPNGHELRHGLYQHLVGMQAWRKRFFFRKWVEEWTIIFQETCSNQLTKLTITGFLFIPYKRILLNSFTFITFSIFQHLHEAKNALTAMLMQEKRGFQLCMHTMLAVRILVVWHTENCAKKKKSSRVIQRGSTFCRTNISLNWWIS